MSMRGRSAMPSRLHLLQLGLLMLLPQLGAPLLGMDVLGRLNFSQRDGELRLDPR